MNKLTIAWTILFALLFIIVVLPEKSRLICKIRISEKAKICAVFALVVIGWAGWPLFGIELLAAQNRWIAEPSTTVSPASKDIAPVETVQRLGQVGDLFGGLNALVAALAFAGVAVAAYYQYSSTLLARKNAIQGPFFSFLGLHHKIADSLRFDRRMHFPLETSYMDDFGDPPEQYEPTKGREVFADILRAISPNLTNQETILSNGSSLFQSAPPKYAEVLSNYRDLQDDFNYVIGHYFRNLYQILKLIDRDTALNSEEKQKYASILRAQLSSDELALLLINCTDDNVDDGSFRKLLIRYRMLEHLPAERIGDNYEYVVNGNRAIVATKVSVTAFSEPLSKGPNGEVYYGAFGTNSEFRPRA